MPCTFYQCPFCGYKNPSWSDVKDHMIDCSENDPIEIIEDSDEPAPNSD